MTEIREIKSVAQLRFPRESVGPLDAESAARLIAAASDVALILDDHGIIRDLSVSDPRIAEDAFSGVVSRPWIETVTAESRHKVEEMLAAALASGVTGSREINQVSGSGSVPLRYSAVRLSGPDQIVIFGRDLREAAHLQQRLLQAQQAMERDYLRLRQSEARYRVLFQLASEAVLIVDQASKKILEANPAAGALLGEAYAALGGQGFGKLFHPESRDAALGLLADRAATVEAQPVRVRLADGRDDVTMSAALFRQGSAAQALVRLRTATEIADTGTPVAQHHLLAVLARIPDAFVVAGADLSILEANAAFLELTQLPSPEAASGEALGRFLGRPGVDLSVLMANLREHGWVKNFATVIRPLYGPEESVEISAVAVREQGAAYYGFAMRHLVEDRRASAPRQELPRTAEQLAQLVGRVSLREIVGEATDSIERMCIEAALKLTSNNRALTAELLGVSRQSLYSKLHRFGLNNFDASSHSDP